MYKPINSKEAVEDARKQQKSPLFICNYDGSLARRNPGKDCNQTWYSVSRDPKPSDNAKPADMKHPFIKHLISLTDGQMDLDLMYKSCMRFDIHEDPEVGLYDSITIKDRGKTIKTTVGRLMLNKCMLFPVANHPKFEFLNEVCNWKKLSKIWRKAVNYAMEGSLTQDDVLDLIESSNEFGLRLSTVVNASINEDMMNPDDEFTEFRDKTIAAAKKVFEENGDYSVLEKAENEVVEFAKKHFKDNDMAELYDSANKAKWGNDFKNLNIVMGSMPDLSGGKPVYIDNALVDGIDKSFLPNITNVAMIGAMDRGLNTAYAGTIYKDLSHGLNHIQGLTHDCGTTEGKMFKSDDEFDYVNRYIIEKGESILVTMDNVHKYVGKTVKMRYPLTCKEKNGHFCRKCLGEFMFKALQQDTIPIGVYISEVGSNLLNVLMQSTHNLGSKMFHIKNFNDYVYPAGADLFEHKIDPITKLEKVYCKTDIKWILPISAIEAVDTYYKVLAHGSILDAGDGKQHTIVFGSDVSTTPTEIIRPKPSEGEDEPLDKHVIFCYKKGDCFLNTVNSVRSNMTVYRMLKVFLGGNLSNLVPVETHLDTLKNNFLANVDLGAADLSLEILVASLARDINDPKKPARETGSKKYIFASLYELAVMGGTFNAVFGPDAGKALMITLAKSEEEQTKTVSPLEKALRS